MAHVEIYTSPSCGYCHRAKQLLQRKGVAFTEFDVSDDFAKMKEMLARSGGARTVPQIFINDHGVGGCDELYALDRAGKLDEMLK